MNHVGLNYSYVLFFVYFFFLFLLITTNVLILYASNRLVTFSLCPYFFGGSHNHISA